MSEMGDAVVEARYLNEGEKSWEDICRRVADAIGETLEEKEDFHAMLLDKVFLPNSPTLMNAGTGIGQLSACFVLPVGDDMNAIFDAVKWTAMIHKSGGGTGFDFSHLRAEGSPVGSTRGIASGPLSFMRVFNEATETVKQGGKRRGANMGILRCDHPDIEKFIAAKQTEGRLANFNFSVMVDDKFMKTVSGEGYSCKEKELFDKIIENQWNNGEPSFLFFDAINKNNPTPELGPIEATNPCGEQPLYPFESCNLGSIDVSKCVTDDGQFDFYELQNITGSAVRFLDAVIDKNKFPLPQIEEATKRTRKIGLGVMGFHDALIKMGIPYDSQRAIELAEEIMSNIKTIAMEISQDLGKQKGLAPHFSEHHTYMRRNACLTCIAPTGSISIIAGCWSGIEPAIWVMQRRNTVGKEFFVVHPLFEKMLREEAPKRGIDEEGIQKAIADIHTSGSIEAIDWLPKKTKRLYKSAFDLTWKQHLDIVIAFQKYVDAAVSKTVNMPANSTKQDFKNAVVYAWKNGLKGVTLYRTGSRDDEVLCLKDAPKQSTILTREPFYDEKRKEWRWLPRRPDTLQSYGIKKMRTGCGEMLIDISEMDNRPYECLGDYTLRGGGCDAMFRTIRVLLGLCFRWGVPTWDVVKNLKAIKCDVAREKFRRGEADGLSCANCIGRYLEENLPDDIEEMAYPFRNGNGIIIDSKPAVVKPVEKRMDSCPECGCEITHEEGCRKCHNCGWSQC
jgi:ribonucleoside-diphosphate reductase alpha chain